MSSSVFKSRCQPVLCKYDLVTELHLIIYELQKKKALPTLLVYHDGEVIGNHVRVTDIFGTNYKQWKTWRAFYRSKFLLQKIFN